MTAADREVVALRLVAATAEKLAGDLAAGRLWPGEKADALTQIHRALKDVANDRR